ncbi:hypothetical protein ACQEV2_42670 [Streptomyces sp. CA-251387]|uniref:hypothetical protein n=1 Tax=Streptomyces sp. CA-251387 TaxID=3240064 RepID=UPI003D8AE4E5
MLRGWCAYFQPACRAPPSNTCTHIVWHQACSAVVTTTVGDDRPARRSHCSTRRRYAQRDTDTGER